MAAKNKPTIEVAGLSMRFNLSQEKHDSLKEAFINIFRSKTKREGEEFWALQDVSFKLYAGDRIGILGLNGAGKSTLLKAIAGVYKPTEGLVKRRGSIAPLLELGAGFDKEYTARENIYLYGAVLGYTREFIDSKFDEIIKFAELQDFVDVPLKNYSSGMKSRLGFAICTAVHPDILILDEVLSVGDARFRKKSEMRIREMFEGDVTVLFVSHSLAQVRNICNKAMILDHGRLAHFGDIEEISEIYEAMIANDEESQKALAIERRSKRRIKRQARFVDAYRIMQKMNLSVDEVLDLMDIPEAKRQHYIEGIEKEKAKAEKNKEKNKG